MDTRGHEGAGEGGGANAPCRGTRRSWACDPGSPLAKPAAPTEHVGACSTVVGSRPPEATTLLSTCPRCLKFHASAVDDLDGAVAAARNALARVRGLYRGDVLQVLIEDLHAHSRSTPTVSGRTVTAPARQPHPGLRRWRTVVVHMADTRSGSLCDCCSLISASKSTVTT